MTVTNNFIIIYFLLWNEAKPYNKNKLKRLYIFVIK